MRIHLSVLALLTPFVAAQNSSLTAHPQETLQNGNGNLVPFGVITSGQFGEGRTQFLVPKDELPSFPAVLAGIEIHGQGAAVMDYASLKLNIGPSTAVTLSSNFASNLPASPTTVLQATALQVSYVGTWTPITFTVPYVHDGASAMVIDIQKVVQTAASYPFMTMSTSSSPTRTDRPAMVYAFGFPGSGASLSTVGQYAATPLSFRLVWSNTPTIRNLSDVGTSGNQYGVGSNVTLTVNGTPNHLWVLAAALTFLPTAVPVPGLQGDLRLNGPVVFAGGLLDPNGVATQLVAIPNNPGLVGFYLTYQGAIIDPATVGISLTNGTDHFVNL